MPKVDIWMPIYIGDYLRDTQELTAEEHGVYILLLMHYWQKKGDIGSDIDRLARVCKTDAETVRFILGNYFELVDGGYKNKRGDEELGMAAGRKGSATANATKKWGVGELSNKGKRSQRLMLAREKGTHTAQEWARMLEYFGKCLRCGATNDLVKDHITPIYQGGSDSIENIQPLCRSCNASKGPDNTDYRPPNWREAIKTPAECLPNRCSSSSSSSSYKEEREEKKEDAHIQKPGGQRIDAHIKTWNGLGLPNYRYTSLNMREKDRADSLRTLSVYGDEEITAAIRNYSEISNSSEHEAFPVYPTFAGFLATGIEKYADDAKPFDRCRKKGAAGKSEGALASRSDAWGPDDVARQRGEREAAEAPTPEELAELDRIKREAAKTPLGRAVVSMLGDG